MNAKVIEKMLLLVRFQQMRDLCFEEGRICAKCPYEKFAPCSMSSTEEVIKSCTDTFREWLFEENILEEGD